MLSLQLHSTLAVAVLVQAGLIGFIVLLIPLSRLRAWRRDRVQRRIERRLSPELHESLDLGQPTAALRAASRGREQAVLRAMLVRVSLNLRGEEALKLEALAETLGIAKLELGRLRAWRAWVRAQAAANLGVLRVTVAFERIRELLQDRNVQVRIAAMLALVDIRPKAAGEAILPLLSDASPLIVSRARELLLDVGPSIVPALIRLIGATPCVATRRAALDVLAVIETDESSADLLLELTYNSDLDIRIKAVKAAASLQYARFSKRFTKLLSDKSWEVRSQAAKGLGELYDEEAVGALRAALSDENRWVRKHAATALMEQGEAGERALREAVAAPDEAAREIALYTLRAVESVP